MNCSVCGAPLPDGARFCPACGALVGSPINTDERKVVTVLFADLVNSTELARRLDPERAREVLGLFFDAATEELHALRGRPEKFIGDAVMAVFGLPTVHEDDALRAVRAGLAIRSRLVRMCELVGLPEPLEVRIGIETGEAATGLGPAGQLLVTGQVVNAAARLQAAADPGQILAGPTTVALTGSAVSFGPGRRVQAKGFDGELEAHPVEELSPRSSRRTIAFVGRSSELEILRQSLVRVTSSRQPVLATIVGEPGIGKSRLADELVAGLPSDVTVLTDRTSSYADTATFAPAAAMVGELAGIGDADPSDVAHRKLHALVDGLQGYTRDDPLVDRLSTLFEVAERRDESTFVQDVHIGFVGLVDALTRRGPVVCVFEDVHLLRPPMLELIERLTSRARGGGRPVMALALSRTDIDRERPTWGSASANTLTLRLDPLDGEEAADLVRKAAGGRIDAPAIGAIASRTGGNPFFIIETTGMLQGGTVSPDTLPPTVQAVVSARLDALTPRLRDLTRRAASFFVSFDLDEIRVIDPEATPEELHALTEAEILVRDEGSRAVHWRLRHAMLRDVAYASLPKRERVRLHQLIADWLLEGDHPGWAAEHLELAARASLDLDPGDRSAADRAADALIAAGDRALRRMDSRSAVEDYERALAFAGPEGSWQVREARALAGMGEAHYWLAEYAAATAALEHAVALGEHLGDALTIAVGLRFLGDIAINVRADLDEAEALLGRSLEAAESLGEPATIARTLLFAGWVPWTRRRYADADAIWRRALDLAGPDDWWARIRALNSLSINLTGGPEALASGPDGADPLVEALALSDEADRLAEAAGDPFSIAMTTVQRARVLEELGRADEAIPCLDRAIAIFDDVGARWELGDAMAERGIVKRDLGLLEEAEQDLRGAIRISEELGERQLASWTWRALARLAEKRGDMADAEDFHRRSREADEGFRRSREALPRKR